MSSSCTVHTTTLLLAFLLVLPVLTPARRIDMSRSRHRHHRSRGHTVGTTTSKTIGTAVFMKPDLYRDGEEATLRTETVQVAGSSLPDCSHACGSCLPCRLVMVSFVCSSLEEAETCPMAYKCMCHSKSYPVP